MTRNTEPHQKCSSRKPPASGPKTEAPAPIPIHRATARVMVLPEYSAVISESVVG